MNFPKELKYAKSDEWVKVEGEIATIGISDYAQSQLGDIVYFEFTVEPGEEVTAGQALGSVDSAKATAEVNIPVSGTVLEINEDIADEVEVLNQDPYGKGWLAKIKISDPAELAELMDAEAYEAYCESR
ncbi:MAG TPA: glycine cleavage system protein GcvH [Anaerolineaceae bacterium]|nr:MAG: Glycine cleavage system H protein [Anaerolineae bacterium 49_20]HAE85872.1 glycine cleavage system protein GcvH [Anaerolineaceae bacterium]